MAMACQLRIVKCVWWMIWKDCLPWLRLTPGQEVRTLLLKGSNCVCTINNRYFKVAPIGGYHMSNAVHEVTKFGHLHNLFFAQLLEMFADKLHYEAFPLIIFPGSGTTTLYSKNVQNIAN